MKKVNVMKTVVAVAMATTMLMGMSTNVFADGEDFETRILFDDAGDTESINIEYDRSSNGQETFSGNFENPSIDKHKAFQALIDEIDPLNRVYGMNGSNSEATDLKDTKLISQQEYSLSPYAATTPTDVWLTQYGHIQYGNNSGYSNVSSDAQGYVWAEGVTDLLSFPNLVGDSMESWGGTSMGWFGNAVPAKIKIMEYVKTGGTFISLSFPFGIGFSGSSTSISRTLVEETNVDIVGGELPNVRSEGTNVTSMERTTVGLTTVGSYTYSATSTVHFKSSF